MLVKILSQLAELLMGSYLPQLSQVINLLGWLLKEQIGVVCLKFVLVAPLINYQILAKAPNPNFNQHPKLLLVTFEVIRAIIGEGSFLGTPIFL